MDWGSMGLSGAAATNAGLALLGGGSIASGGFGIAGGTALLTAALTFSTDVAFDYTIGKAISEYKYSKLTELSRDIPTLPIPINDSGPEAYEKALEILKEIDNSSPLYSDSNLQVIYMAITSIENNSETLDVEESITNNSLLSLLYFISSDFVNAKESAALAIEDSESKDMQSTLPSFIYATSSLYDKEVDFKEITNDYFRYSILDEPDNPLIPLLFSIYMDRIFLRFDDGALNSSVLDDIFEIMQDPSIESHRVFNYLSIFSRYLILIKLEQQKISSLAESDNRSIRSDPKTLEVVTKSFANYNALISRANNVLSHFLGLDMDDDQVKKVSSLYDTLGMYIQDNARLSELIYELMEDQHKLTIVWNE
jgi:hypothetical protein